MKQQLFIRILFAIFLIGFIESSQAQNILKINAKELTQAPQSQLDAVFEQYELYEIPVQYLYDALKNTSHAEVELQLGTQRTWKWDVNQHAIYTEDMASWSMNSDGLKKNVTPQNKAYRGYHINGVTGKMALTLNTFFFYGFTEVNGNTWFFEPLYHYIPGTDPNKIIFYDAAKVKDPGHHTCGYTEMQKFQDLEINDPEHVKVQSIGGLRGCKVLELNIASDWLDYLKYGQNAATMEAHHTGVINNVQVNYTGQFNDDIQFLINEFWNSTCNSCDPWTSSTNPGTLLNSFMNWGNGGGFVDDTYDNAELWTDRDFDGSTIGIAFVPGVCKNTRYNAIQDWTTNASLLRCTVSHEFGHNFNMDHDGASGFIMSPSVSNTNTWSAASKTSMNNYLPTISCLSACGGGLPPVADFLGDPTEGCKPLVVAFTDQSTNNPSSWSWTFPGGTPAASTAKNPLVTYNTKGTYNVSLTVTNGFGTSSVTKNLYIKVRDIPTAGFNAVENDPIVVFTNTSVDGDTYLWDFGDGEQSNEKDPVHEYQNDGVYTVTMTVTNACGSKTTTKTVIIITPPVPNFMADVTVGCTPMVVTFTDLSTPNATSYNWSFPGGVPTISTLKNPVVTYYLPGKFDVTLKVSNSAGSNTIVKKDYIQAKTKPVPNFSYQNQPGGKVQFYDSTSYAGAYKWHFGDGDTSIVQNPLHQYAQPGQYYVTLSVTNDCGTVDLLDTVTVVLVPNALFSASPIPACEGSSVQFTDQSQFNPTSWLWTFTGGNPASSTVQNPTVIYNAPGTYTVTLQATNAAGTGTLTKTDYIVIQPLPSADFNAVVTSGFKAQFNHTGSNATSYAWTFGDGGTSNVKNPNHDYTQAGTFTVTLITTNNCGNDTMEQQVTIVLPPVAAFTVSKNTICVGETIQFTDQSTNNPTSWSWTFEGGTPESSTLQNPSITYNTPGVYSVSFTVSNIGGNNSHTKTNYIQVLGPPVAGFTLSIVGQSIQIINNTTGGSSWEWNFGDGTNGSEKEPIHNYTTGGVYTIILIATGPCGSDTTEQTITIQGGAPPLAEFSSNTQKGCGPLTVQFSDNSLGVPTTWSWTFAGGSPATSNLQNPTVIYPSPGIYGVTLTVTNANGSNTIKKEQFITVENTPLANFTYATQGTQVTFTNLSGFSTSYLWQFGDGTTSTEANPVHTYSGNGPYTVILTAQNPCGTNTYTVVINLVGTIEIEFLKKITLHPNPASTFTQLELQGTALNQNLQIEMIDVLGQSWLVKEITFTHSGMIIELPIESLSKGNYLVRIKSEKGSSTVPLLKQ